MKEENKNKMNQKKSYHVYRLFTAEIKILVSDC